MIDEEQLKRALRDGDDHEWEMYIDIISKVLEERNAYLTQLTSVQARCTELLEEVRALKSAARDANDAYSAGYADGCADEASYVPYCGAV